MQPDGSLTSLPAPNLASMSRQQALDYFDNTWLLTEVLFSALQGEPRTAARAAPALVGRAGGSIPCSGLRLRPRRRGGAGVGRMPGRLPAPLRPAATRTTAPVHLLCRLGRLFVPPPP